MSHEPVTAIIPARYHSTRLPGKPLIEVHGQTLIERVYRRVEQASSIGRTIVATDDRRILEAVRRFGGTAVMTRSDHASGTDRLAEAARDMDGDAIVVNIQGDEPLIEPELVDIAVDRACDGDQDVVTLMTPLESPDDVRDPNRVKVVVDLDGNALYFSRLPVPPAGPWFLHVGLYVYRAGFLKRLSGLRVTPLEQAERLEQLRILEHGFRIRVVPVETVSWGIDTPSDLERFERLLERVHG